MLEEPSLLEVVWVSAAVREFTDDELRALLRHSRTANQEKGITGLLLYHQRSFLQLMEGPPDAVHDTFENRIRRDPRHTAITLLLKRKAAERVFPDFSMGFVASGGRPLRDFPGFRDYRETTCGLLSLHGDFRLLGRIIAAFHEGSWHQALAATGQPVSASGR